ncbi:MAG: ATP phosphoribosyltransferase regulatory subunit, partial [Proteobacteria bacterium]
ELLPEQARRVEHCRRRLLDICAGWGYEYVVPPLVEFSDSLLVGLGADLDELTCKFADRETGKTLAVRADITPQVARIDAHSLGRANVTRLSYAGSTLKSVANSIPADRSPVQMGAEIFGSADITADVEVVDLLLSLVTQNGLSDVTFDIGHVAFCDLVLDATGLDDEQRETVLSLLARKATSELDRFLVTLTNQHEREQVQLLASMHGGRDVIARAREGFADVPGVGALMDDLEAVLASCDRNGNVNVYIDLTEAHGYRYHSGVVFALYARELGAPIAKGGRYDGVGEAFGRSRPATGFAIDLKAWSMLAEIPEVASTFVSSPAVDCRELLTAESNLRANGKVVIKALGDSIDPRCTQELVRIEDEWLLKPVEKN